VSEAFQQVKQAAIEAVANSATECSSTEEDTTACLAQDVS
jgi:hypothetical protein